MTSDNAPPPRPVSRRHILALGGAAVAVLGGAGLAAIAITRGGDGQRAATPPTAFPPQTGAELTATATAAAYATDLARPPVPPNTPVSAASRLETLRPTEGQWEGREFARGEAIPWHAGVFFMDTVRGTIRGLRVASTPAENVEPQNYMVSKGNRLIVAQGAKIGYVFDRERSLSWEFDLSGVLVRGISDGYLLLATGAAAQINYGSKDGIWLRLVPISARAQARAKGVPLGVVELKDVTFNDLREAHLSDDFEIAWFWTYNQVRGEVTPYLLVKGDLKAYRPVAVPAGSSVQVRWLDSDRVMLEVYGGDDGTPPESRLVSISAEAGASAIAFIEGSNAYLSPDRKYVAYVENEFGNWRGQGESGPFEAAFRNVIIKRASGEPILRVRSSDLMFGDNLTGQHWLSDSSGVVLQAVVGNEPGVRGMAIATLDGRFEPLPIPPGEGGVWFDSARMGALPSPSDISLFSVGRFKLLNRKTGELFKQAIGEDGPTHVLPWGRDSSEMRFALPHGGHGGGGASLMLKPRIERWPFPVARQVRVSGAGDCLNLRVSPDTDAEVRGCYADGTVFEIAAQASGAEGLLNLGGWWVSVRNAAGEAGWVSADYLEWA